MRTIQPAKTGSKARSIRFGQKQKHQHEHQHAEPFICKQVWQGPPVEKDDEKIDPDIRELGDYFNIEAGAQNKNVAIQSLDARNVGSRDWTRP